MRVSLNRYPKMVGRFEFNTTMTTAPLKFYAHVRLSIPPTATPTALDGPLLDEQALGAENSDERFLVEVYKLKAEL